MRIDGLALVVGILAVATVAALIAALRWFPRAKELIIHRIRKDLAQDHGPSFAELTSEFVQTLTPVAKLARPGTSEELSRLSKQLGRAGFRHPRAAEVYLAAKVVLGFVTPIALLAATHGTTRPIAHVPMLAIVLFAAGFYAPNLWLRARIAGRQRSIERGLADTLDFLVTCIEAGLGLDSALQRVTAETRHAYPLLGQELELTFLETTAGIPRVEAFRRLAERTGVAELKSLAATLTQTEMFGTSVGTALRIQAESIRTRRTQRAEEKAAYASVKMTVPLILCVLPALIAIIVGPAMVKVMEQGGLFGRH